MKLILPLILVFVLGGTVTAGRLITEGQTYQQMYDKADLVVVATAHKTKDTSERTKVLGTLDVIGVETEFFTRLTLKGSKEVKIFILHHYRELDESSSQNGPSFVLSHRSPGQKPDFLMFLKKEKDDRYSPITGQVDPASLSILELRSSVLPEGN